MLHKAMPSARLQCKMQNSTQAQSCTLRVQGCLMCDCSLLVLTMLQNCASHGWLAGSSASLSFAKAWLSCCQAQQADPQTAHQQALFLPVASPPQPDALSPVHQHRISPAPTMHLSSSSSSVTVKPPPATQAAAQQPASQRQQPEVVVTHSITPGGDQQAGAVEKPAELPADTVSPTELCTSTGTGTGTGDDSQDTQHHPDSMPGTAPSPHQSLQPTSLSQVSITCCKLAVRRVICQRLTNLQPCIWW